MKPKEAFELFNTFKRRAGSVSDVMRRAKTE
jgi:hypothetical protein